MATGQHLTDLAVALAERGHEVTVVTSERGYDDPGVRFPRQENWKGIRILRIASWSLGKETKWRRALTFGSFLMNCSFRLLFMRRFDVVVALTSPPLISFLGTLFVRLKGGRFCFWVMDLNPDEAIAAGWLKADSIAARLLQRLLKYSLQHAEKIFVLDRFMRDRILAKGVDLQQLFILPPWAHDDAIHFDAAGREAFRTQHGVNNKFVVMYSGNHSPCHPLNTLLAAAKEMKNQSEFVFYFVGGGSEQAKVSAFAKKNRLENIVCLPYRPLNQLSASLSAADLHVVVMGNDFVGIVHPCKVYNIMAVGAPMLYIGPTASHVSDITNQQSEKIFTVEHGDVSGIIAALKQAARTGESFSTRQELTSGLVNFSKQHLLPQMVSLLESNKRGTAAIPEAISADIGVLREH